MKQCIGWTIKCWFKGQKRAVCIDTSDLADDVAEGIDEYIYHKFECDDKIKSED